MSTKTDAKRERRLPTVEEATERAMTLPAITLSDLAVLTGVGVSTVQRAAVKGTLDVPAARIGQRWIIPSAPVRELLRMNVKPEQGAA
ncbi:MAG: helix-turn-helix domain-containing protein [Microthrixaceae bacterium]|nr:helix-turn-helix domain-containing protein [Microthrixaceae bacterium]